MAKVDDVKMKLAKKLLDSLTDKETREEDFFSAIKRNFSSIIDDEEELEVLFSFYKEKYTFSIILEKIAEVYAKNLTEDEMIDIINFYNTKTGKSWINKYPFIMRDVIKITEEYGTSIAKDLIKKSR